jgi:hypothetical protein
VNLCIYSSIDNDVAPQLMKRELKKMNGFVYEQVYIFDEERNANVFTHAYKKVGSGRPGYKSKHSSIEEFVWTLCSNYSSPAAFALLCSGGNMHKQAVAFLEAINDPRFAELVYDDRSVFAFRNGVYICSLNEFQPHSQYRGIAARMYFDEGFDESLCTMPIEDIETPFTNSIAAVQDWGREEGDGAQVLKYMYAFLFGRTMYQVSRQEKARCRRRRRRPGPPLLHFLVPRVP